MALADGQPHSWIKVSQADTYVCMMSMCALVGIWLYQSSRAEVLSGYVSTFMTEAFDWVDEISTFEALRVRIGRAIEVHERREREQQLGAEVKEKCDGCAQFMDPDCRNSNYTLFSECTCGGGGCDCLSCCAGRARSACCGVVPRSPGCGNFSHSVAS